MTRSLILVPLALGLLNLIPLSGRVDSLESGSSLEGVTLTLVLSGETTTTDTSGYFAFQADALPGDTLLVSHPDFVSTRIPLGDRNANAPSLIIRLMPQPMSADRAATPDAARIDE